MSGFVVIYRWRVPEEQEQRFRREWHNMTLQLRIEGALGSCLTRDGQGEFVGIALWPSEEARLGAFANLPRTEPIPGVQRLDEMLLDVEDDLWVNSPLRS